MTDLKLELIAFLESLGDGEALFDVVDENVVTCRMPDAGTYYELLGEKWTRTDLLADKMLEISPQWEYYIGEVDDTEEDEDADDPLFGDPDWDPDNE